VTCFGLLLTPVFYVLLRRLTARRTARSRRQRQRPITPSPDTQMLNTLLKRSVALIVTASLAGCAVGRTTSAPIRP